jgi:hypothetical protein
MPAVQDDSQRDRRTAKRILAIGLPLVVIAATGVGYAYWTSGGSGTGSAATANPGNTLSVTQTSTVSGLVPGGAAQPITVRVTNAASASNPVHVNQVVASFTVTPSGTNTCAASNYDLAGATMTTTSPAAASHDVAPGGTLDFVGATLALTETGGNQDGCKGATVNLSYLAS